MRAFQSAAFFSTRDRVDCSGGGGWDSIKAKWMERVRWSSKSGVRAKGRASFQSEM